VTTDAWIVATPNPVPPGSTSTTIQWDVASERPGQIWVSVDGQPEALLAEAQRGSTNVDWISPGSTYAFSLYGDRERTDRLGTVAVVRGRKQVPCLPPGASHHLRLYAGRHRAHLLHTATVTADGLLSARAAGLRLRREGEQHLADGHLLAALACFDRGIAADPDSSELYEARVDTLRALGRHAQALACCQQALARFPHDSGLWRGQAETYMAFAKFLDAADSAERGLALAPRDARLLRLAHQAQATLERAKAGTGRQPGPSDVEAARHD
jgi:hypothetical protein